MNYLNAKNIAEYFANTPQITFEITQKCNLACVYCGYGELYSNKDIREGKDLPLANAITFLKHLKGMWHDGYDTQGSSNLVISFYGGEPLLNMRFIRGIVAYVEKELSAFGKKITYSMTTNALLLPQYMDFLVDKNSRDMQDVL